MSNNLAVKEPNYDEISTQKINFDNIYNFSLFEPIDEKKREEKREKIVIQRKEKQEKILKISQVGKIIKVFVAFLSIVALFASILALNVKCDEIATQITEVENEIKIAESEGVRLQSELKRKTTIGEIKNYAENILGMVKLESYKITYLHKDEQNKVVLSGDKSYNDTLWAKIKKTFT